MSKISIEGMSASFALGIFGGPLPGIPYDAADGHLLLIFEDDSGLERVISQ